MSFGDAEYDAKRKKTRREIRPDQPVVLASDYITEELRQRAPAAGAHELIYKSNTVDDWCEAVARYANAQVKVAS